MIGLLRVAMFPGAIGIDVGKHIDRGIAALEDAVGSLSIYAAILAEESAGYA